MSEQQSGEHSPVDTLLPMVNLVLIQAGEVFRDPTRRSLGNLFHTRSQVGVMVPTALNSFHAALDELEVEIVSVFYISPILPFGLSRPAGLTVAKLQAKEVFTRDLAVSRARRAQREREAADAAAAEKDRIAAEEASARAAENMEAEKFSISMGNTGEMGVTITDELADPHNIGHGGSTTKEGSEVVASETNEWSTGQAKPPKPPPLDLSEATGSDTKPTGDESDALPATAEATMHSESAHLNETPSTAGYKIMDFESMFNDPTGDPGTEDMNFDLNSFGGDGGEHDFLGSQSLDGDGGVSMDISSTQPVAAGNVDVSALLPGLETYANAEDDTSMFGNPIADSTTLPPATTTIATSAPQSSVPLLGESTDLLPAETSLGDLFLTSDGLGAGDGVGDDGDGNFASEFDNLFYGIGND
ncbi:MAG: hypothetical protein M1813_007678 [Trichoglossum hirsutum]|nr:MAG: hypothetical protein M1813_007678 [Trichoglossum hirsutum]